MLETQTQNCFLMTVCIRTCLHVCIHVYIYTDGRLESVGTTLKAQ